jgi:predicted RNA-binding protein with PIN domain
LENRILLPVFSDFDNWQERGFALLALSKYIFQRMEIIIDGYNLIGRDGGLRGSLEHKRSWLVQQLGAFRQRKSFEVTVVFDGWRSGLRNVVEEQRAGVKVVFSPIGEKADSVIVRLARRQGSGCVVVSSDREIRDAVEKFGAVAVSSGEFAEILSGADRPDDHARYLEPESEPSRRGNPRRLSKAEKRHADVLRKLIS